MFRSTKGASKARRDLINNEISYLRDLIPLPESARQRLSQLQVMSLALCYIRKCNHFDKMFGGRVGARPPVMDFTKAISGFLLVTTRDGKLLYLSENVTEYLGHSMVDLMTQGDSVYDIIHPRDHGEVRSSLTAQVVQPGDDFSFFCRMNVSRSLKRQGAYGDHKVMYVRGHFSTHPSLADTFGSEPVFTALVTPLITPDVKDHVLQNCPGVFHSLHSLDMKYIQLSSSSLFHTGYQEDEILGTSWYGTIHPDDMIEAREKHSKLLQSSHESGCMLTVRILARDGSWFWVNCVLRVKTSDSDASERYIMCVNQLIDETEVEHFKQQSVLYTSHIARSPEFLGQSPQGDTGDWGYSQQGDGYSSGGYMEGEIRVNPHMSPRALTAGPAYPLPATCGDTTWNSDVMSDVVINGEDRESRGVKRRAPPVDVECKKQPRFGFSASSAEETFDGAVGEAGIDSELLLSALSQSLLALGSIDGGSRGGGVITSTHTVHELGTRYTQLKKGPGLRVLHPDSLVMSPPAARVPSTTSPGPFSPDSLTDTDNSRFTASDVIKNPQTYVIIPKALLASANTLMSQPVPSPTLSVEQCVPSVVSEVEDETVSEIFSPPPYIKPEVHPLPGLSLLDARQIEEFFREQSIETSAAKKHQMFEEEDLLSKSLVDLLALQGGEVLARLMADVVPTRESTHELVSSVDALSGPMEEMTSSPLEDLFGPASTPLSTVGSDYIDLLSPTL